jgi:TonB family protein
VFVAISSAAVFACGADVANTPVLNATIPTSVPDASAPTPIVDASDSSDDAGARYQSAVRFENLAPIGVSARAMATYLVAMHNRIHPIFTDQFLSDLDKQPRTDPMNDMHLSVELEIIVNPDGSVSKMGITRSSGVKEFDYHALDAVYRAAPFGPTPKIVQSPDGMFYIHWTFNRDPVLGCSTANVRPFMLKN